MTNYEKAHSDHTTQLAVMQIHHSNIEKRLDDIQVDIRDSAERGAHSVNEQLAKVINEVQLLATKTRRA